MPDVNVHALTMPVAFGERTVSITPTAVETDRGLLLIDVGPQGVLDGLSNVLSDVGHDVDDVHRIVLTHHDADHAGGLAELRERTDVTVSAHRDEAPYVRGTRPPEKGSGDRYPPADVDDELVDGDEFATRAGPLRVVETPGHTVGHVSLFLPDESLLIAGDALVADGDEPLSGPKLAYTLDMTTATESLGRLAEHDIDHTICHHGGYVPLGTDRIREIESALSADD